MNEDSRRLSHEPASCSSHGSPSNIKLEQGNAISKEWTIEKSDALAVRREDHCVDHLTVKDLVVGGGNYRHFLERKDRGGGDALRAKGKFV